MSNDKQKKPRDYLSRDGRRFRVRNDRPWPIQGWQVYGVGVGLEHIAECPTPTIAGMVADALEQAAETEEEKACQSDQRTS